MKLLSALTALAVTFGIATPASAITITSITGTWQSAVVSGGEAENLGTSSISWGHVPKGYSQSAYSFEGSATPLETAVDEMFNPGTFTHSNNPIYTKGEMLKSAELALSFTIEGVDQAFSSVFNFVHWETENLKPKHKNAICANGERRSSKINSKGCADRVTLELNEDKSEAFTADGMDYVLDVTGFLYNGQSLSSFWTQERTENDAILQASYRLVNGDTPPEVPLPASGLLLLGGLAGLALKRRKG